MSLSGLAQVHIELTSRCDKRTLCSFCGHQRQDVNPITYGDMDYGLLQRIRRQLVPGIVVAFHRDGEPTAYPLLGHALRLFASFTTSIVTHGLNLARLAETLVGHCTTITVSVYRGDPDGALQYAVLKEFLAVHPTRVRPLVQVKIVGDMDEDDMEKIQALGVPIIRRLIHNPTGNHHYAHTSPTIPEGGLCLDALHRPSIDWQGTVYLCNRLDPRQATKIGSLREQTLEEIWNGSKRQAMIHAHTLGRRADANTLCAKCTFWGVPSQWTPTKELHMVTA